MERRDEADARGLDARLVGDALHLEADEVVGEQDAPELLRHRDGTLATDRLLAFEDLGLDLLVPDRLAGTGDRHRPECPIGMAGIRSSPTDSPRTRRRRPPRHAPHRDHPLETRSCSKPAARASSSPSSSTTSESCLTAT